jgi:hypothetical protein
MKSDQIEQLAEWLHNTVCCLRGSAWVSVGLLAPIPWEDLEEWQRDNYRAVARELLENPPECLVSVPVVVEGRS